MTDLRPLRELDTAPLFAPLSTELLSLLRGLTPADWDRPTVAGAWRVRDIVAHLLDGELRKLAAHRDGHSLDPAGTVNDYAGIIALIQRLNAEGVAAGRHLSPRLLTDLLEITGAWMSDFLATLDPDAPALFAVAWAGENESTNRFDTAREYTERWHHQMQIRLAVGERGQSAVLLAEQYAEPLLDTAMRVLPHAYREVDADDDAMLTLAVDAPWSREWTLRRRSGRWRLYEGSSSAPTARIRGTADDWWRLFFNALPAGDATRAFESDGPSALVEPLWRARSVMV